MGQLEFLTRMALGRSPYQPERPDIGEPSNSSLHDYDTVNPMDDAQQYDSKGRPVNPTTEVQNAEMRNAHNSVLALVGVVEDRDQARTVRFDLIKKEREKVLAAENDRGEDLAFVMDIVPGIVWWAETLTKRFQIGLYDLNMTFVEVLALEFRGFSSNGLKGWIGVLLPGAPAYIVWKVGRVLLILSLEALTGRLQKLVIGRPSVRYRTAKCIHFAADLFYQANLVVIDIFLLPLDFYATAQMLRLAPQSPMLPLSRSFLPSNTLSFRNFGWKPLITIPILRWGLSPAVLLLIRTSAMRHMDRDFPNFSFATDFTYPNINEAYYPPHISQRRRSKLLHDPIGYYLQLGLDLRTHFLCWCGWKVYNPRLTDIVNDTEFENNLISAPPPNAAGITKTTDRRLRSTALAHLAPLLLATAIDTVFQIIIFLPFESLALRSVTSAYMTSSSPKSLQASTALSHLIPLTSTKAPALRFFTNYTSKIVLSLALQLVIQTAVFAGAYRLSRQQGIMGFDWGSRWKIGGVVYKRPPAGSGVVMVEP